MPTLRYIKGFDDKRMQIFSAIELRESPLGFAYALPNLQKLLFPVP